MAIIVRKYPLGTPRGFQLRRQGTRQLNQLTPDFGPYRAPHNIPARLGSTLSRNAAVRRGRSLRPQAEAGWAPYAWCFWASRRSDIADLWLTVAARAVTHSTDSALRDGPIVGVTNPKAIGFFVVALPGFTNGTSGQIVPQFLLLGVLFPLIALVLDSIWAVAAGAASQWLSRSPRRLAAIGGAGGVVMIALGLSVAATGRKD